MANTIKLKRGSGSDPTASDLVVGEVALRTDTGKLFTKKDDNSVAEISGSGLPLSGGTLTGDLTIPDKIIHSGDTNTFIRFAADDQFSVHTSGSSRLSITDTQIQHSLNTQIAGSLTMSHTNADFAVNDSAGTNVFTVNSNTGNVNTVGNITVSGTVDGRDVATDGTKLDGIESNATADQTKSDIDALGIAASTASTLATARTIAGVSFDGSANISLNNNAITNGAGYITATLTEEQVEDFVGGMVTGNTETGITVTYQDSDGTLDFVVASQTDNNFTNADHSKLDGIESGATADQSASEIVALIADQTIAPSTIDMEDDEKIKLGDSDDLEIFHTGSFSKIQNSTGDLNLYADTNVGIYNAAGTETKALFATDGAVSLYHDNAVKFSTSSSGASITGTLDVTSGITLDDSITHSGDTNTKIRFPAADTFSVETAGSERARGTSGGKVFVGFTDRSSTVDASTSTLAAYGNSSTTTGNVAGSFFGGAVTSQRFVLSFSNNNGIVGSISTHGTQTQFNESSDYRLKENVVPISNAITRLKTLKPSRFNFISDATTTLDGFLAHEVSEAVPEAVSGEKDGMAGVTYYEEGDTLPSGKEYGDPKTYSTTKIEPQQLDQSKLVPLLTAALQESISKIEILENKVAVLESSQMAIKFS